MAPLLPVCVAEHGFTLLPGDTPLQELQNHVLRALRMEMQPHATPFDDGVVQQLPDEAWTECREHSHGLEGLPSQVSQLGVLSLSLEELALNGQRVLNFVVTWPTTPISNADALGGFPLGTLEIQYTFFGYDPRSFVSQPLPSRVRALRA
jgi:hypothetical protein